MTPYSHPRLRELLAGILADPSCDAARLAYADALAELGDGDRAAQERAEFIRVQVELASWQPPYSPWCKRCGWVYESCPCEDKSIHPPEMRRLYTLRRRERELIPGDRLYYSKGDYDYLTITPECFRRGFVEGLTMPAAALAHLDAVRACQPVVKVTLTTWPSWMGQRAPDGLWEVWCEELPGRKVTGKPPPAHLVPAWMLGGLFPGVTFELPPAAMPPRVFRASERGLLP